MARWGYEIADLTKVEKDISELNRLGAEGWEAVRMVATWEQVASGSSTRLLC